MKVKILVILLIIIVAIIATKIDLQLSKPNIKQVKLENNLISFTDKILFPDFIIQSLDNKEINSKNISEEVILLNFWASWCMPCRKELPDMLELLEKFSGKVALFTIAIDKDKNASLEFLKKIINKDITNIDHTYWGWDKDQNISLKIFNTNKVPETIIINKNRFMVKKIVGIIDWHDPKIEQLLYTLINDNP